MDQDLDHLRSIAEVWRLSRAQTGRIGDIGRIVGIVLIREGQVCGVLSEMRFAAVEPGLFAVDQEGRVFTAGRLDEGRWSAAWVEVGGAEIPTNGRFGVLIYTFKRVYLITRKG